MCKQGDYLAQKEPLRLPGCMPIRPEDLLDPMTNRTKQEYNVFLQTGLKMRETDGFLFNTWENLEATTLKALREEECYGFIPVYPVVPLFRPVQLQSSSSRSGEEIEMMVRKVIIAVADNLEGKAIRTEVKEFQNNGKKAWTEVGSSFNALSQLTKQWEMSSQAQRHKLKAP
ncbi:anthocyanidin 3-O-glucosyltransferase 5-like [Fagus crenata]